VWRWGWMWKYARAARGCLPDCNSDHIRYSGMHCAMWLRGFFFPVEQGSTETHRRSAVHCALWLSEDQLKRVDMHPHLALE
jgi:hypothetical protein